VRLPASLKKRSGVVLNTMVLIYLFEDHDTYGSVCEGIVDAVASGAFSAVVTPITIAELVVKPIESGRSDIADAYRAAVASMTNVSVAAIDERVGAMAGALRARYRKPLPDMMQVAAALAYERPAIITGDKALKKVGEVDVFLLDDLRA
jgi:predicted nucleic acid-binding protein